MKWRTTQQPADLVTWQQLKAHLRLTDASQKEYVMELAAECIAHAERLMECSLMARIITTTYYAGDAIGGAIYLPRGPIISITSITDDNGTVITDYDLSAVGNSDRLNINVAVSYPVVVVYSAGHSSAADVDADIRGAIRTHVATRFLFREAQATQSISSVVQLDDFYRARSRGSHAK